jgi:hypothetical protein
MDPTAVTWVIEPIQWLITRFSAAKDRSTAEKKAAIEALVAALRETRIYFGTQRNARARIRQSEEDLSRLWVDASEKVRHFDEDLAGRCYTKGKYWADPVGWRDEDLLNAGIMLEQVEESLIQLRERLNQ